VIPIFEDKNSFYLKTKTENPITKALKMRKLSDINVILRKIPIDKPKKREYYKFINK